MIMRNIKSLFYIIIISLLVPFSACEDTELNPVLAPDTAIHGFARTQQGSPTSFFFGNNASAVNFEIQWISIDQANTVTKIDLFVEWKESYIDAEGNPRTANHGKKLFKSIEGSAVPANRTYTSFSIAAKDLTELFKTAEFDYGDGKGKVSVFNNTFKTLRTPNSTFIPDDGFTLTWAFTTADGRYFDSWSPSVCSEFPGANCNRTFNVVCASDLAGTYSAVTTGTSTDGCCPNVTTVMKDLVLTKTGDGKYTINDWSGGLYLEWYAVYGITPTTNLTKEVNDVCNKFIINGFTEPFGESASATGTIDPVAKTITYTWINGYGDKGTVVMTKK
jgi:hypothetical protein